MSGAIFHIQPWTIRILEVEQLLETEIRNTVPELEILFMGAAPLGLPGKNDIDLDILCSTKDISHYTKKLTPVLGKPEKISADMSIWGFEKDGFEVDCILSDPVASHVPKQKSVFELLKANADLLEEYRNLKISCDGIPYQEYEKIKKQFFMQLLNK